MARSLRPRSSGRRRAPAPAGDEDVRRLLEQGDIRGAATFALRRHGPAVRKLIGSLLQDEADAAEAFSRFEEHLWTGLRAFRGESSIRTWAFRLARNAAADVGKDAWPRHRDPLDASPGPLELAFEEPDHDLAELRDRFAELRRHLSPEDQTLLALRIDDELGWSEIARACACAGRPLDPSTVMKRFGRAVERLRRMARQRGVRR